MRYLLLCAAMTLLLGSHERSRDGAPLKNAYTATQMADDNHMEYEFSDKNEEMDWYQKVDASERNFSNIESKKVPFR